MKILKHIGFALLGLILGLAVIVGGLFLWALTATDTSQLARLLVWQEGSIFGDSSSNDWQRFPSRVIHASPEPVGFEVATPDWLADLTLDDKPLAAYLEATNTTAFIILHGDEILYEGYFNGSSREATQSSLSMAKSFATTLVGIAVDEGYIASLDDPVTLYIPELLDRDPRFAHITIRHLVAMTSGLKFEEYLSPWDDATTSYWSPDLRAAALNTEIAEAPGYRFHYNDYNTILIGMVLERATGMTVSDYLETRLWRPMGAEGEASWSLDSKHSGFEQMSVGINARAIDFAKLGWLFLNQGKNGDRQVVPAAWVEEATRMDTTTDPAAEYQYGWWVDVSRGGNAYNADGHRGQFIYVYPRADLVLVRHGTDTGGIYWTGLLGDIARWIERQMPG
jgi:CubicO group peptidase (beta-lactamase class C family)